VLDDLPAAPMPWHVRCGDRSVAANQLGTMPVERLLERVDRAGYETLRQVRHALREISH
jgi:hypothetical protein